MRRALIVAIALASAARVARADDEILKGAVVAIEHQEIYVNLGADQGVATASAVRIKRVIHLHHPVTRAPVDEWIPIGSGNVTEARGKLSRAVLGELTAQIKVGDIAEILVSRPDATVAPAPPTHVVATTVAPAPQAPVDPQVEAVLAAFTAQAGASVPARIVGWERFLSTHQDSPFAPAIRKDLDELTALRDELAPPAQAIDRGIGDVVIPVDAAAPTVAVAHTPVEVVVVLARAGDVASAFLHYRPRDAKVYRRVLMTREHDLYLRARIPADIVAAPGVDYFVEGSLADGRAARLVRTADAPVAVAVAAPPLLDQFGPAPGQSMVKLATDYLDFATFDRRAGDHRDHMVVATADFTYAIGTHLESVGVGFGAYSGVGGSANTAWSETSPIPTGGFRYGYVDAEVGTDDLGIHLGAAGRLIAGVDASGFGMGGEGRFRLGRRTGANLQVIVNSIAHVGTLSDIKFGVSPLTNLLVGVSVGATDQPNNGDIAVKLGTELEWLGFEHMSILVRGSWQGRNVDHAGLGGGAGLGFYW